MTTMPLSIRQFEQKEIAFITFVKRLCGDLFLNRLAILLQDFKMQ